MENKQDLYYYTLRSSRYNNVTAKENEQISSLDFLYAIEKGIYDGIDYKPVFKQIRTEPDKAIRANLKKKNLFAMALGAVFLNSRTSTLLEASGLIVLDFDQIENLQEQKMKISCFGFVFSCFISPSGDGLKVVIKTSCCSAIEYTILIKQLFKFFEKEFSLVADTSKQNINDLCFFSFDKDIYINMDASNWVAEKYLTEEEINSVQKGKILIADFSIDSLESIVKQIEEQGIDITASYHNWLKIGFALVSGLGEQGRIYFHRISKFHSEYDEIIADNQYDNCLSSKGDGITIASLFYMASNYGIHYKKKNEKVKISIIHSNILSNLLYQIKRVNFREIAGFEDESEKLNKKHFLVCCIENILETAANNHWALCKNQNFIYLFNGAYWDLIEENTLKMFLGEAAEKMGIDKYEARFYLFRDQLYEQFIATANLPRPEPSKDTVLINLKNGTFEISTNKRELKAPDKNDFQSYQLPFNYDPTATAPIFEAFLNKVLPDISMQMILSEYFGYVFTKSLKLEKTLMLYGTGANGKSVVFEIINALLGGDKNVSNYSLQSLTNENGYSRAMIGTKLLNYATEINGKLDTSIFKQLVSGEPVEARLPYNPPFSQTNYAKFIFNVNELPKEVEYTNAYFRRFMIIPFDVTIPDDEQDKDLSKKIIQSELSGVFNWILAGLERLLEQKGFTSNDKINKRLEDYKKQSDSIQMFIEEENYVKDLNTTTSLKILYRCYKDYSEENGYKQCSVRTFSERLQNIGFEFVRKNYGKAVFTKKGISS